jgi:hypothetical protein
MLQAHAARLMRQPIITKALTTQYYSILPLEL